MRTENQDHEVSKANEAGHILGLLAQASDAGLRVCCEDMAVLAVLALLALVCRAVALFHVMAVLLGAASTLLGRIGVISAHSSGGCLSESRHGG